MRDLQRDSAVCVWGVVYSRVAPFTVVLLAIVVFLGVKVHLRRDTHRFLVPVRERFVCVINWLSDVRD